MNALCMTPVSWCQMNHQHFNSLPSHISYLRLNAFTSSSSSCLHWRIHLIAHTELPNWIVVEDPTGSCFPAGVMANYMHMRAAALLATMLLCLPSSSKCDYCATDFSQVSFADVTAACPAANQGASAACCAAFNTKACQYEAQVNDFGSLCPMMFINYLGAAGPYQEGYFVGPCVDGSKGFCIH